MKYVRRPATVHAEQLDPADLKGSIEILDGFIAGGMFDFDLDAESDDQLAAVKTYPEMNWEPLPTGWWAIRWAEDCYTIMDDEEFHRDFEETTE